MSDTPETRPPSASPPRQVLDPAWEDELRAGQAQEGESGGLEGELAVLHLLRHMRDPEPLSAAAMAEVWGAIAPVVAPKRWWQRVWVLAGVPALAGAAALLVALLPSGEGERASSQVAMGEAAAPSAERVAMAEVDRRAAAEGFAPAPPRMAEPALDRAAKAEFEAASAPAEYAPPPPPAAPLGGLGRASRPPSDALDAVGAGSRESAKVTTTRATATPMPMKKSAEDERRTRGDGDRPRDGLVATLGEPRAQQRVGGAFPGIASAEAQEGVASPGRSATAILLEQQFTGFEPEARRELGGRVELRRAQARGALLASARGAQS